MWGNFCAADSSTTFVVSGDMPALLCRTSPKFIVAPLWQMIAAGASCAMNR